MDKLVVGSRGSKLALIQSKIFINKVKTLYPHLKIEIKTIKTKGDKIQDKPLREIGKNNIFIGEIEQALVDGNIDIAVHSLKDMPAVVAQPFTLACYPEREDARDVLISRKGHNFSELSKDSVLGSGSLRRQIQIKHNWSFLNFENIRGNVDTRIEKMNNSKLTGLILAAAGLHRLGLNHLITCYISPAKCIPAAGQGTLGIEISSNRIDLIKLLAPLDDLKTRIVSIAERTYLAEMGGDCHLPIGVYGIITKGKLLLTGFLAGDSGKPYLQKQLVSDIGFKNKANSEFKKQLVIKAEKAGKNLAKELLLEGGDKILE